MDNFNELDNIAETTERNSGSNTLPTGDYEMLLFAVKPGQSQGGTNNETYDFIVRNDINQQYQNKHVFVPIWKTEKAKSRRAQFMKDIWLATGNNPAQFRQLGGLDDYINAVSGRPVLAHVLEQDDEYNGEKRKKNTIFPNAKGKQNNLKLSEFPQVSHQFKQVNSNQNSGFGNQQSAGNVFGGNPVFGGEITNDDLPF